MAQRGQGLAASDRKTGNMQGIRRCPRVIYLRGFCCCLGSQRQRIVQKRYNAPALRRHAVEQVPLVLVKQAELALRTHAEPSR